MAFEFTRQDAIVDVSFLNNNLVESLQNESELQKQSFATAHQNFIADKYKPDRIDLDELLNEFGNVSKIYHKKLEQGLYSITQDGLYIVNENIKTENNIEKEIEFTYYRGELIVYSYSESKKNKDEKYIYYKFISFAEDGKTILHSKENYAINDLRIEIYRDSEGYVTEWFEEKGKYIDAFSTIEPTSKIKKDSAGNIIEAKEWEYDSSGRITSYTASNNKNYCQIENSYVDDLIISNYKNRDGITYWNRIFNSKVGKHTHERLFNENGLLIREETFSYSANGNLILRIDKGANGDILSSKEIQYSADETPILIINRGITGDILSSISVA